MSSSADRQKHKNTFVLVFIIVSTNTNEIMLCVKRLYLYYTALSYTISKALGKKLLSFISYIYQWHLETKSCEVTLMSVIFSGRSVLGNLKQSTWPLWAPHHWIIIVLSGSPSVMVCVLTIISFLNDFTRHEQKTFKIGRETIYGSERTFFSRHTFLCLSCCFLLIRSRRKQD